MKSHLLCVFISPAPMQYPSGPAPGQMGGMYGPLAGYNMPAPPTLPAVANTVLTTQNIQNPRTLQVTSSINYNLYGLYIGSLAICLIR